MCFYFNGFKIDQLMLNQRGNVYSKPKSKEKTHDYI